MSGAILNFSTFSITDADSGAIGQRAAVYHQFSDSGEYLVAVARAGQHVADVLLKVIDGAFAKQANLDCSQFDACNGCGDGSPQNTLEMSPDGYLVIFASKGRGGYAVTATPADDTSQVLFDSAALRDGDAFSFVMLKPGIYSLLNALDGNVAPLPITVPYPSNYRSGVSIEKPIEFELSDEISARSTSTVGCCQTAVVKVQGVSARVVIKIGNPLSEPSEATMATTILEFQNGSHNIPGVILQWSSNVPAEWSDFVIEDVTDSSVKRFNASSSRTEVSNGLVTRTISIEEMQMAASPGLTNLQQVATEVGELSIDAETVYCVLEVDQLRQVGYETTLMDCVIGEEITCGGDQYTVIAFFHYLVIEETGISTVLKYVVMQV